MGEVKEIEQKKGDQKPKKDDPWMAAEGMRDGGGDRVVVENEKR